jgi:MFS superfamily sulfate permease-like transporter
MQEKVSMVNFFTLSFRSPIVVASIVAAYLLLSVGGSHALSVGPVPQITVLASNAVENVVHSAPIGTAITMDAVIEADGALPLAADVYVGVLSPDGHSSSWTGNPQAPVLVKGPTVPFLRNIVTTGAVSYRIVIPNFGAGGLQGWYMLYGVVVITGSDPGDPKHWISSSFFPLLVTAP